VIVDLAAQPDDRIADLGVAQEAAFGQQHVFQAGILNRRAGQEARMGVDGRVRIKEIKRRVRAGQHQVGLVERADGSDVFPIAFEIVAEHILGVNRGRDDLPAKIVILVFAQHLEQHLCLEQVDAHRAEEGALGVGPALEIFQHGRVFGLFGKARNAHVGLTLEQPKAAGLASAHRLHRHGDIGVMLQVKIGHLAVIHAVQVIAGQDEHVLGASGADFKQLLAHRVGRALVPVGGGHGLLSGPDLHPAGMEGVELVAFGDVAVQRHRVELGQHGDAVNARIDTVADRNIDQAVFAGDGHGRLGAHPGQREQAGAAAAAQNDTQKIFHRVWHFQPPGW